MGFPCVRLERCFPELYGFVLLDPVRLDAALGGAATGRNLLELFSTSDLGERVAADGIAIPVMDVAAGYYGVLVRHAATPSPWPAPRLSSPGWVLGTTTGALVLCGAGYLVEWDPRHPRHRRVDVPAGWYSVEIRGHLFDQGDRDDGGYEFVLTPAGARPAFGGRLDQEFGLMPESPRRPAVRIVHLDGPTFQALAGGDLAAANAVSPVPATAYLAGPECRGVWQIRSRQFAEDPASAAWVTGIVWDERRGLAVGAAGYHGPPDASGMVEIGYRVDPAYRRRGYARAALEALLRRAADEPQVRTVRVTISPDNAASRGLALQYGFVEVGEQWDDEDGLEIIYEVPAGGPGGPAAGSTP